MIMMMKVIMIKKTKIPHVNQIHLIMISTLKMMMMIIDHQQFDENKLMQQNKKKLNIVNHFKCCLKEERKNKVSIFQFLFIKKTFS
jgi:hypothetical protein